MAKTCVCDGCQWQGNEDEAFVIDLNEWADFSNYDEITCLPVGECPECHAPVYTQSACDAWDMAKLAPEMHTQLKRIQGWLFIDLLHADRPLCKENAAKALQEINELLNPLEAL